MARHLFSAILFALLAAPVWADESSESKTEPPPEERTVTTEHSLRIGGETIRYRAVAGTLHLDNAKDDEPAASVFYIAYFRDGVSDTDQRPLTFTFNGGPGSSSVWLHLGTFGPRRVSFADATQPAPPPYRLEDNPESILDVTDLVFIDPVGTGFSHTVGDGKDEDFLGLEQDARAVGDFIERFTSREGRWNSPKYLAGESYGTTRAARLVQHLQDRGMFFNGVVLVSSILNFQTARFETGNDLPYITFLPTYAATAWYHNALPDRPQDLTAFLHEVREFALTDYALALMQGSRLDQDTAADIASRLSAYTGLPSEFIRQANLRVSIGRFTKELLRERRRTVGRLDSRFIGLDDDAAGEFYDHDPSYTAIYGPYTAAVNDYLREELGFEIDREYQILSMQVNRAWDWSSPGRAGYVNVAEDLRAAMSRNTHLKVFVANGYYDLATPFFATEYTMDHLGLEPRLREQIEMHYYEAGHMMYIHPPSLAKLRADLLGFYE